MNFEMIKNVLFSAAKEMGLTEYDVYFRMASDTSAEALNRELSGCTSGTVGGVAFRCAVDGHIGAASTQCLTEQELKALVPRAIANAAIIETDEAPIFFEGSASYQKVSCDVPTIADVTTLRHAAIELQEQLYAASPLMTDGTSSGAGSAVVEMALANSRGLSLSHKAGMCYTYAEAIVNEGGEPSFGFASRQTLSTDTGLAAEATNEALRRLGAGAIKTGTYNVIFSAKQMRALLGAYSGIFSGKNALLGLSLLKGKEGSEVAAPCVTVVDDPFYPENTMQMPFDAEGVATKAKNLIENGVLKTLLYDLTYARKAGVESTGNAMRGISDPVAISPYTLRIEKGNDTPEALLMKLDNGVYITEMKGLHSGADAVTGDFSVESAGFLVENGKLTRPVHSFTVAGNFFTLLKSVTGVADNVEMGLSSASCTAAPDVLVSGLSLAGE